MSDGGSIGFEALGGWRHPESRGLDPGWKFLQASGATGRLRGAFGAHSRWPFAAQINGAGELKNRYSSAILQNLACTTICWGFMGMKP